jgi:regulator of sirC expression with transglutaminase-like and TPR domain
MRRIAAASMSANRRRRSGGAETFAGQPAGRKNNVMQPAESRHPMIEPPETPDRESCAAFLQALGASDGRVLPLAEAALVLAAFDRPRVDFGHYREHLQMIARDVGCHQGAAGELAERARALNEIILLKHGYSGDELTYDDLQNVNLMRVIDRRKGLPVVLGILYIDAARAQGWEAAGLAFPGHFLIRLSEHAERLIVDPFHRGQICGAAELRELLKAVAGAERELAPEYYAPVADRDVLLRLQNNLKSRLIQQQRYERATEIIERMLWLAPDVADLWREAGLLHRELGNLRAATGALEQYVVRAQDGAERHQAAALLQQLRGQLN